MSGTRKLNRGPKINDSDKLLHTLQNHLTIHQVQKHMQLVWFPYSHDKQELCRLLEQDISEFIKSSKTVRCEKTGEQKKQY